MRIKPLDETRCLETAGATLELYETLDGHTLGQNMVVVNWLTGVELSLEYVKSRYHDNARGAFIPRAYTAATAIAKLFLRNGFKVNPPKFTAGQRHPLATFPFRVSLEIHDDQTYWLKENGWSIVPVKETEIC